MSVMYENKKWLHKSYVDDVRSTRDIAKECGVSKTKILKQLERIQQIG